MKEFEPTEEGHIVRLIKENTAQPEFGEITKVFEHTEPDDGSNFEANVKLRDSDKTRRGVPVANNPFMGAISVPEVGDTVLVDFLDGESEAPVVVGFMHNDEDRAPVGEAGMYRLRKGDLYFEMEPNGEWARITHKSSDTGNPNSKIELNQSGQVNLTGYNQSATNSGATVSGDGTTGPFELNHSLETVPSTAHVQATNSAAAGDFWVSNKTDSTVEITYSSAPPSGSDNLSYDVTVVE